MDIKPYYKTGDGKVVELEQQDILNLCNKYIVELIIPDGYKYVHCQNNELTKLILPDGCKIGYCNNNQLKELIVPDVCKYVGVDMKSVTMINVVEKMDLFI